MAISPIVIIYLITACVNLWPVSGTKSMTCSNEPVVRIGYPGASVTFDCKYPEGQENFIKQLCKEDGNAHCTNLISADTASLTKKDRFSLEDDKQHRVYNVIMSSLTQDDSGKYLCATERLMDGSTSCLTESDLIVLKWDTVVPRMIVHHSGETIQILCHYPESHESNNKFLCKGQNPFNCEELIHTTEQERDVVEGRFDIRDNQRQKYFYVTIKNVIAADSGTYWCGSDRTWQHTENTKVILTVASTKAHVGQEKESESNDDTGDRHDKTGLIAGVVVGLASLLIFVLIILLCRNKLPRSLVCCGAEESEETEDQITVTEHDKEQGDPQYAEVQMSNQQPRSGTSVPTIYATVNHDHHP